MRTTFLIDGFNFYHSLIDPKFKFGNKYKWFNYYHFCESFLGKDDILQDVYYFSALATHREESSWQRHKIFMSALEAYNVKIILGRFKRKEQKCRSFHREPPQKCLGSCKRDIIRYEEKATDVNLALYLYHLANIDAYDKVFLVTGDTDLVPAIEITKMQFPKKRIGVIFPFARARTELKAAAHMTRKTKEKEHLDMFRLPEEVFINENDKVYCPPEWQIE